MPEKRLGSRRTYKDLGLPQLRSFCEVCRRGSYAAAARALLLTSPAVWEQVQALERHFGAKLFERDGSGVRATPHGQRLLELVEPLLAGLDSTRDVLHQEGGLFPEQLAVVSNLRVLVVEISEALAQFRERYPSICLAVRYLSSEEIAPRVLDGTADVTLTLEPGPDERTTRGTLFEPAGELDYLLIAPSRHPLLSRTQLRLGALIEHNLVLAETGSYSRQRVQEVLHQHNLTARLRLAAQTSSDEYTVYCVRAGLGLGIAIGNARSPLYRGLGVRSLRQWFGTARFGFMWKEGAHLPPIPHELAEQLRRCILEKTAERPARRSRPT